MAARKPPLYFTSQCVPLFLARLRAEGAPVAPLLAAHGLPPDVEQATEVRMPLRTFHRFSDAAAEIAGDPHLGLHAAIAPPRGHYGVLEFVLRTSSDLGAAFAALQRHSRLLNELITFTLESDERGETSVVHRILQEPLACGTQGNEFTLAVLVHMARELTGTAFSPRRAWFAHPARASTEALATFLGTDDLRFGAGENGMTFDRAQLSLPVVGAEPALHAILEETARTLKAERPGQDNFLPLVREAVRRSLERGAPQLERVAPALHMSARTLQRRLSERGTSFQDIVDDVRRAEARRHLQDGRVGLTEVAFRLGYSDPRAFARAHQRWTGMSPGAARRSRAG